MRDKTVNICLHSCILQLCHLESVVAQGKGKAMLVEGEDTARVSVNKPDITVHSERGYCWPMKFRGHHMMYTSPPHRGGKLLSVSGM